MGHAPYPIRSLVNSCEEFYQAKQLFSLTQGDWHVLAQLQKVSSVPKCKNILRIAKKKVTRGTEFKLNVFSGSWQGLPMLKSGLFAAGLLCKCSV